jgi:Septum formation
VTAWDWRAQFAKLRTRGGWLAVLIVMVCCVALAVGVALVVRSNRPAVRAEDLRVGDCIQEAAKNVLPERVQPVSCDRPHFGEVFAVLMLPDALAYPGAQATPALRENCGSKFFDYAPDAPEGPTFHVIVGYPRATAWATGDRALVCVAVSKHERSSSIRS